MIYKKCNFFIYYTNMGLYFKYNILKAQNKIDTPKSPNSLLISTEFTNNQLFNGRFDSVKQPINHLQLDII